MKPVKKPRRALKIILIAALAVAAGAGGFAAYTAYSLSLIPAMTFEDMLAYTTENNENALITVGTVTGGETGYTVYGANGVILPRAEHTYEIGSLTKTFTAALLFKAADEGKLSLDDSIGKYLSLPEQDYYPTLRRLVTHTSGYRDWYFEAPMASNLFAGRNDFYGVSSEMLIERAGRIRLRDAAYGFTYSNFGMAVIGAVLSEVYGKEYTALVNAFAREELGLPDTMISDGSGDLGNYWEWEENDAYLPAGALQSDISDMLEYARMQLQGGPGYLAATHDALAEIGATGGSNARMNIRMDAIGAAWMIDTENHIVWHNGGTGDYNCYLGFDLEKQTAVVILSNLPPGYRIPATVMGVKLLTDLRE